MAGLTELEKAKRLMDKCQTPAGKQICQIVIDKLTRKMLVPGYIEKQPRKPRH